MKTLPAFRIHLSNDLSYITSMAAGMTLEQAREYYIGQSFLQSDDTLARCVNVEQIA